MLTDRRNPYESRLQKLGTQWYDLRLRRGYCVKNKSISVLLSVGALGCGAWTAWCVYANGQFSYDGKRQLSRQIVEGTAEYITLPEGGVGLDVGCGGGANIKNSGRGLRTVSGKYIGL